MKTAALTISAWGNSHAIRISRELMQAMDITPDTPLEATVLSKGCLELRAAKQRPSLAEKLAAFDPHLHGGELMQDAPQGAEFGHTA
jgi:antitoxin component of MazEF toxin-antitoxin module